MSYACPSTCTQCPALAHCRRRSGGAAATPGRGRSLRRGLPAPPALGRLPLWRRQLRGVRRRGGLEAGERLAAAPAGRQPVHCTILLSLLFYISHIWIHSIIKIWGCCRTLPNIQQRFRPLPACGRHATEKLGASAECRRVGRIFSNLKTVQGQLCSFASTAFRQHWCCISAVVPPHSDAAIRPAIALRLSSASPLATTACSMRHGCMGGRAVCT